MTTPHDSADRQRDAMRAALLNQGFDLAAIDGMLATSTTTYRVRDAVSDAVHAMRQERPRSVKTWEPYLQLLVDGLPELCPCSCPAC